MSKTNDYLHELVMGISKAVYWELEAADRELPNGWRWVNVEDVAALVSRGITPKHDDECDEMVLGQTCLATI